MVEKSKDGLHRCPHCGSSDVSLDTKKGELKCNYCRTIFEAKSDNELGGIEGMKGETRGEGAADIIPGEDIVKTFRCPSCGAEVVINTEEATNASCHWCKHIFTIREKISNGAVPDLVLPFKVTKEEAEKKAKKCLDDNMLVIPSDFMQSFDEKEIRGVYFPYLIVDVNGHLDMNGQGEKRVKAQGDNMVETYDISREFDILVDDLTVESSAKRLNQDTYVNSNNIINAILPYDTENAVVWDANYLRGFASEKRNVNVDNLKEVVALQIGDIARNRAKNETASEYDLGIRWEHEHLGIKGTKWKAAYLPVWLFSYKNDENSNDKRIYYIAINGRTGELAACLPEKGSFKKIKNQTKAGSVIKLVITVSVIVMILAAIFNLNGVLTLTVFWSIYIMPIWAIVYYKSRKNQTFADDKKQAGILINQNMRHHHETETVAEIKNLKKTDKYVHSVNKPYHTQILGKNDDRVIGALSTGRGEMLDSERGRFQMGRNYTNNGISAAAMNYKNRKNRSQNSGLIWIIVLVIIIIFATMASDTKSGSNSNYRSDSSWSSSSSWDYDSGGSSFDSGGFDYSYDY